MGDQGELPGNFGARPPGWAVRVRRDDGSIAGAGILLAADRVLTCAHVAPMDQRFTLEFVGEPDAEPVRAEVLPDCWVPETLDSDGDPSGDVALLRLAEPRPRVRPASLYRLSPTHRTAHMYGFPKDYSGGIYFRANVVGGTGRDGQVQLSPVRRNELVRPGFSGAGVVDDQTGQVIGMVLSRVRERDGSGFSFMSPTETIVQHLPRVAQWTHGLSAVDESLVSGNGEEPLDQPFAERLARWFEGHGRPVKISVVADERGPRAATLRRAIKLADRELRSSASTGQASQHPPSTIPPAGGLDLAVDATDRTVAEVAERIAARTGLGVRAGQAPADRIRAGAVTLSIVVVGVDRAADPAALLELLGVLAEHDSRLLLVFRDPHTASRHQAESELVVRPWRERLTRLCERLAEITDRLAGELRERMSQVVSDTRRATDVLVKAYALREHVSRLADPPLDPEQAVDLAPYERAAARAVTRLNQMIEHLDELIRQREELRGRLKSYQVLAQEGSDREDLEGSARYLAAYHLLYRAPCDITAAQAAVDRYTRYVDGLPDQPTEVGGEAP
ncbi:S1 family peptidase [Streptantibioticus ferralitis]|uniref:Serine protease n=1 Tax=Streptantibioticus ferralitis TaxID=236510 RepID=A0ABT5YWZ6_9ACTN|nr:serine protease [Streptantibioticus ferralitis]MDF2256070.1 serine protease [Streptantibioticus ferralitis]